MKIFPAEDDDDGDEEYSSLDIRFLNVRPSDANRLEPKPIILSYVQDNYRVN